MLEVAEGPPPRVAVLECSLTLAGALASQIASRWRVRAVPHVLGSAIPEGTPVVSTFFHANQVREAIAQDDPIEATFLRIRPSGELLQRLADGSGPVTVLETDEALGHNVASYLRRALGDARPIEWEIPTDPARAIEAAPGEMKLISPQNWERLDLEIRRRPDVALLEFEVDPADLERIGAKRGWSDRRTDPRGIPQE